MCRLVGAGLSQAQWALESSGQRQTGGSPGDSEQPCDGWNIGRHGGHGVHVVRIQPLMRNLYSSSGSCLWQVPLLLHQKQALAWLLWRESQQPHGGILGESDLVIRVDVHFIFFLFPPFLSSPHVRAREEQRERERTLSGLHTEHRAQCGRTHNNEIMT